MCKALQENQKGLTKEDVFRCAFKVCILQALKLELNLSSNLDATSPYNSASVPSTTFSLRKQKCEVPSLCCLWQESINVYKSNLKYWFSIASERSCKGATDRCQPSWGLQLLAAFAFSSLDVSVISPPTSVLFCALETEHLVTTDATGGSSLQRLAMQIPFLTVSF